MVEVGIEGLREGVRQAYSAAAEHPQGEHPFPLGRAFAESLGYSLDLLRRIPSISVEVFAGVSNVSEFAEIASGVTVLDLGCGGGLDSLIAARRVGNEGRVAGVDFSQAMLARARAGSQQTGIHNLGLYLADVENLPIKDNSVDVALINGIFNLNLSRCAIFQELARVVKTGGSVYAAELILQGPLPEDQTGETSWFA